MFSYLVTSPMKISACNKPNRVNMYTCVTRFLTLSLFRLAKTLSVSATPVTDHLKSNTQIFFYNEYSTCVNGKNTTIKK